MLIVYLKDTPVSAYTIHSTGLGLMSLNSAVILSHKIYWQGSIVCVVLLYTDCLCFMNTYFVNCTIGYSIAMVTHLLNKSNYFHFFTICESVDLHVYLV